ncbi:MAG: YqeG family HAD IIIA-type phosphatase [Oscillospiraceae bacterium]|jgi:HAD superfamily phosphatase (TIGR01668 family)|nr:YqeG family HAD IIIA-type phosphatase [Oscillospiraceae bacterium]
MLLRPDIIVDGVFDLTPELLRSRGISLLLADLDNTLAPYGGKPPSDALLDWKAKMLDGGVEIFIVSNTNKPRAGLFAEQFGVGYIKHARKPTRGGILEAIERCGRTPSETALVGDQIFTDILGANRAGTTSVRVRPISLNNPLYRARYWAEQCILFLINGKTYKNR